MEPPICAFSHRDQRDEPAVRFELVKFANYEPIDGPGHPDGLLWFCEDYLKQAQALSHLSSDDALRRMREAEASSSE